MSEFELSNFNSPKSHTSDEKKSSATNSWKESIVEDEVPVHLFLSRENTSPQNASQGNKIKEKMFKKSVQETSFFTEKTFKNNDEDVDLVLSLPSDPEELNSDESENVSSGSKSQRFLGLASKKTNKVQNVKSGGEPRKIKMSDIEFDKKTKSLKLNTNVDSDSVVDIHIQKRTDLSYRERIRDRFNVMKEKAVESLSRPQSRPHSRLKLLMTKERSRMEDLLKQEEDKVSAAIERHRKMKMRWQEISRNSLEKRRKSQDEGDDFFIEPQNQMSGAESFVSEDTKSIPDPESPQTVQQDKKVLAAELLGLKDIWDLVEYVKPEIIDNKKKDLREKQLFYPSTRPVSMADKLEPGLTPRLKEEEGLYIGEQIKVPSKVKNKMESRILKTDEGRKWFNKDGEMISAICPLKPFTQRPLLDDDDEDFLSTQITLKSAAIGDTNYKYMDISGNINYVFDIDINSVDFTHHPLFSKEHVVAQRLKELYLKYKKKKEADNMNRLNERLNALRSSKNNIKAIINQSGDNANLRENLKKCERDLREVKDLRYVEGYNHKQLVDKILTTWKDLLKLRESQGFQNTSLKLIIKKKVDQDVKQLKIKWDAEIKEEIKEIVEELEREYEKELDVFNKKYDIWSKNIKKKKEKKENRNEDSIERISDTESVNDSESEKSDSIEEPKPPKPVAVSEIKAQVVEKFKKSFRQPGEPEIDLVLTQTTNMEMPLYNNKEQLRRAAVKKSMIFIKLFYNGKEVCRSKSQPLNQNFSVAVNQRFAIRILEWPESLMIEIHEEAGTLNRNLLVPGIYLPFPDSFTTVYNSEVEKHEFSSRVTVAGQLNAVGAGNKIIPCPDGSDLNNRPVCLYTSGTVSYRVGWVVDNGKILSPPEKYWANKNLEQRTNILEIFRSGGAFDLSKLKEWAEYSKLDPNNPYNSAFFHFIENAEDSEEIKPTHFRLNPLLDDFDFCKESAIESNVRYQLLKLRDAGEPDFIDLRMIPLNEKQINKDIIKENYKKKSAPSSLMEIISSDPIDGLRVWGQKYLEQVQEKLLKEYRLGKKIIRFQEIITEESIPDVGTLGLTFMKWLQPKRPLHPVRKERKKVTPQHLSGQEISVVVNVVRAFEVPVRKELDSVLGKEGIEGFPIVNVRPFVEISFRGITTRTTTAEGANPTWNQDLRISVQCENGNFSSGNLQSIKDTLYLHLFDEIVIDLIEDESARETNIHQRLEKHWLASMEIPFSTLYFNSKIEGTFKLYSPPILLGYEREAHRRRIGLDVGQEAPVPQRDATYITLFVTVQPVLNPPKPIQEKIESREPIHLKKYLEDWQKEVLTSFPHRKVKTLVPDITGKSVCLTRYIKSLQLPEISVERETTPEMAARFVAMIPTKSGGNVFPEYFDIWLTCDQILRLLVGNPEDHAVLLCCYFLQLGLQAYVLLGSGIPFGLMAYVLVIEKENKKSKNFVWDPTNGQKYNVEDSFCPLQKIYCVLNDQNIWANVQTEESPRRTRYDLTKKTDWLPAFGKNLAAPTGSVQPQSIQYRATSRQSVDILRDKMEKKLRDHLMKWRKKSRTLWNRYCVATLRKLLPKLEEATWNSEDNYSPDHAVELQHILSSHKMCGFPINMAYTDIEAVSEAVKATGVHCNESEEVEFALAVYLHPYPNDVLSVWVYVASLVRRR